MVLPDDRLFVDQAAAPLEAPDRAAEDGSLYLLARHYRNRLLTDKLEQLVTLPPSVLRARIKAEVGRMIRDEGHTLTQASTLLLRLPSGPSAQPLPLGRPS